jgi:multiple sugar transport system ATP-binding protein
MAAITITELTKVYEDGTVAVKDLSLTVAEGEFLVLVGSSGCGKSTVLRCVAGLESPTSGTIALDNQVVNDLAPQERDLAMVFQNFALYPHMTVYDNLAFGLKMRRLPRADMQQRVRWVAEKLGLGEYLLKKPRQLSGGQQQRVALGRAMVRQPQAFLMDEPLSNLDAALRVKMRGEILKLQRELEVTILYVTHDQTEALTMGDRVAVLHQGRLQQVASAWELYEHPATQFVAGFIGSPAMNFLSGRLRQGPQGLILEFAGQTVPLPEALVARHPALLQQVGKTVIIGVRPEHLKEKGDMPPGPGVVSFGVEAELVETTGPLNYVHFSLQDLLSPEGDRAPLVASLEATRPMASGQVLQLMVDLNLLHFFDAASGRAI